MANFSFTSDNIIEYVAYTPTGTPILSGTNDYAIISTDDPSVYFAYSPTSVDGVDITFNNIFWNAEQLNIYDPLLAANHYYGNKSAISGNGLVMATMKYKSGVEPDIWDWNGNEWVFRGAANLAITTFCDSLSLSYDGSVISADVYNGGYFTRTYGWDGSAWVLMGKSITLCRFSSMSGDGQIIAYRDATITDEVNIANWAGTSWTDIGSSISAGAGYDVTSINLNNDGTRMAVGFGEYNSLVGEVKIYELTNNHTTITLTHTITASDGQTNDEFGSDMAINADGNVMAIGAPGWSHETTEQGKVYIYTYDGVNWNYHETIRSLTPTPTSRFGSSVDISSNQRVAVGSPGYDHSSLTNAGKVDIYLHS